MFEDTIGYLVKKSHGTHDVANQVHTVYLIIISRMQVFCFIDSDIVFTPMVASCAAKAFARSSKYKSICGLP